MCSACSGDYEDPEMTKWEEEERSEKERWAEDHGYMRYRCSKHGTYWSDSGEPCPQCPEQPADDECEECGHSIELHRDKYGCQYERGDAWVTGNQPEEPTVLMAQGPCGCEAHPDLLQDVLEAAEQHSINGSFLIRELRKAGALPA